MLTDSDDKLCLSLALICLCNFRCTTEFYTGEKIIIRQGSLYVGSEHLENCFLKPLVIKTIYEYQAAY
jgi:hypothetical protein